MNVSEAVTARRSIRAFSPVPVPKEVLSEIMDRALRAPSWGNVQPWKMTLVGGRTLEKIKEEYVVLFGQGHPSKTDFPTPTEFNEVQTARYQELGRGLFTALGIAREDKEKRNAYYRDMMRCLGAPHVIYLHFDKGFDPYALMDGGIILQTIALLAVDHGLGTCFLGQAIRYPDVVRKHSGIPSDQMLVMGLAIGRPVEDHPANRFRSRRGAPGEFIKFVDMD